jgi:hypothetical protein
MTLTHSFQILEEIKIPLEEMEEVLEDWEEEDLVEAVHFSVEIISFNINEEIYLILKIMYIYI